MNNNQNKKEKYLKNENEREIKYMNLTNKINLQDKINNQYYLNHFNYQNVYPNQNSQYKINKNNIEEINKIKVNQQIPNENKKNININTIYNINKLNEKPNFIYYNIQINSKNFSEINYNQDISIADNNTNFITNINGNINKVNKKNNNQVFLQNVGNTTYMNTVIRCLVCISGFYNFYLKYQKEIIDLREKIPITYFFSRIIVHLIQNNGSNFYSLEKFYKIIIYFNPIFKGKSTKNAIDFLIYLIGQLHEDYKIMNNNNIGNSIQETDCHNIKNFLKYLEEKEKSNIFNEFSWINKNSEICWECNKEMTTFKNFYTYDLDFENALNKTILSGKKEISILDCINLLSEEKNIYNIFCKECNRKNNFNKTSTIYSSNKTLIFLIRGIEKKAVVSELSNCQIKIKINENFNLYNKINKNKLFYSLYGLISYDTKKLEYIAYCISPINKKWYKFMKEKIKPIELNHFINDYDFQIFPVIIFYRSE